MVFYKYCLILLEESALTQAMAPSGLKNYYKNVSENKDVSKLVMVLSAVSQTARQDINVILLEFGAYHQLWENEQATVIQVISIL